MPDLPEFQEDSQVTPGPLINSAPIYQANAQIASDINNVTAPVAQSLRDQQVARQASQNAATGNFSTIPRIGEAAQAYDEAGLAANKDDVTTGIINTLNSFYQQALNADGTIDPAALSKFTQGSQAYFNGLMQTVPAENRSWAMQYWTSKVTSLQMDMQKQVMKQQMSAEQFNAYNTANAYDGEVSSANLNGNWEFAKSNLGANISSIQQKASMGLMKPWMAAQRIQQAQQNYYETYYQGQLNKITNNPAPYNLQTIQQQTSSVIDDFKNNASVQSAFANPATLHAAVGRLQSSVKQNFAVKQMDAADLQRNMLAGLDQAIHTGLISPQLDETVTNGYSSDPNKAAEWNNQKAMAINMGNLNSQINNGTIAEAQSALSNAMAMPNQLDYSDPLKAEDEKTVLARALPVLQKSMKEKMANPMDAVQFNPNFISASNDIRNNRNNYPDPVGAITQKALDIQRQQGFKDGQLTVLPSSLVTQNIRNTKNMNPGQQLDWLYNDLPKQVGNNPEFINIALRQMASQPNSSSNLYPLYATAQDPATSASSDDVANALSNKPEFWLKNQDVKLKDLRSAVVNETSPIMSIFRNQAFAGPNPDDQIKQLNTNIDDTVNYAAFLVSKGIDKTTAANTAANVMINDHYNQDSFMGAPYAIPKYDANNNPIDKNDTHTLLNYVLQKGINNGLQVPSNYESNTSDNPAARQADYINSVKNGGAMVINSAGAGFNFRDDRGNLIRDTNGAPLQVSYSDVTNPNKEYQQVLGLQHGFKNKLVNAATGGFDLNLENIDQQAQQLQQSGYQRPSISEVGSILESELRHPLKTIMKSAAEEAEQSSQSIMDIKSSISNQFQSAKNARRNFLNDIGGS